MLLHCAVYVPVQAAAGVHDDVCRHLLEHSCNTVPQMQEAVGLLVQMQADGVPCRIEADPLQAFVRAEVGTVAVMHLAHCWCKRHSHWRSWGMGEPLLGHCSSRGGQVLLASRHVVR